MGVCFLLSLVYLFLLQYLHCVKFVWVVLVIILLINIIISRYFLDEEDLSKCSSSNHLYQEYHSLPFSHPVTSLTQRPIHTSLSLGGVCWNLEVGPTFSILKSSRLIALEYSCLLCVDVGVERRSAGFSIGKNRSDITGRVARYVWVIGWEDWGN